MAKSFCHIWYSGSPVPVVSEIISVELIGNIYLYSTFYPLKDDKKNIHLPYLLACKLPKFHENRVPVSVSIIDSKCPKTYSPSNNLRIHYNLPPDGQEKTGIAVCSKSLSLLDDVSVRLIEWLEVLRSMKVDKINLYVLHAHPNVIKVCKIIVILGGL